MYSLRAVILKRLDNYFFSQKIKEGFITQFAELSPEVCLKLPMLRE